MKKSSNWVYAHIEYLLMAIGGIYFLFVTSTPTLFPPFTEGKAFFAGIGLGILISGIMTFIIKKWKW